jgi:8-oxo-dGTP diphosphatase
LQNQKSKICPPARAVIIDKGHILLCQRLDIPINFYFLPGGHIEDAESAHEAVIREVKEESGAEAKIKRFLGCLEHSFVPGHNSICHNHEYNFVFELESDELKKDKELVQMEDHIKLVWMSLEDLDAIDFRAEPLKRLIPKWLKMDFNSAFGSHMTALN